MPKRAISDYAPVTQTAGQWVAYRLMQDIFLYERQKTPGKVYRSREEILDTYAECYEAINGKRRRRR